jgi:hypothetical protein
LTGLCDGHGPNGRRAARHACHRITTLLAADPRTQSRRPARLLAAMRAAAKAVQAELSQARTCGHEPAFSGTTALFALASPRSGCLCVANIGAFFHSNGRVSPVMMALIAAQQMPVRHKHDCMIHYCMHGTAI